MTVSSRLLPLLLLAACAAQGPPAAEVPLAMPAGAGDPARAAVLAAAPAFADTASLAGRPAEAARQAARLEWLAASLVQRPDWRRATPLLGPALEQGRAELRGALGLAPAVPPPAAAAALLRAAAGLDAGDAGRAAAALDPVSAGQGQALLQRLAALPPLPRAAQATGLAQSELMNDGRWDVD
ncbi:hypothetical protein [Falsiroseomonas tokyonensis]|uniref:Uncharacterized protein n=1 Tax=Falsiroseomonas tokyonensis TaxID=430521 RepID=A0ABV7BYI8_9PROT|nr:hypothetical protein [Falsiroseomonas tokyonensis]MBU8538990.1 hypothetical protein [Falsiroseomonas tokyonensis]